MDCSVTAIAIVQVVFVVSTHWQVGRDLTETLIGYGYPYISSSSSHLSIVGTYICLHHKRNSFGQEGHAVPRRAAGLQCDCYVEAVVHWFRRCLDCCIVPACLKKSSRRLIQMLKHTKIISNQKRKNKCDGHLGSGSSPVSVLREGQMVVEEEQRKKCKGLGGAKFTKWNAREGIVPRLYCDCRAALPFNRNPCFLQVGCAGGRGWIEISWNERRNWFVFVVRISSMFN